MTTLQIIPLAFCFFIAFASMLPAQQVDAQIGNDSVSGSTSSISASVDSSVNSSPTLHGRRSSGLGRGRNYDRDLAAELTLLKASNQDAIRTRAQAAATARMQAEDESGLYPSLAGNSTMASQSGENKVREAVGTGRIVAPSIGAIPDSTRQLTTVGWPIYIDPELFSFNPEFQGFSPDFDQRHLHPSLFGSHLTRTTAGRLRRKTLLSPPSNSLGNPYARPPVDSEWKSTNQDPIASALQRILQPLSADSSTEENSGP